MKEQTSSIKKPFNIAHQSLCLNFSDKLIQLLSGLLKTTEVTSGSFVTINCRSPSYSAEDGGYRPQEIAFKAVSPAELIPVYITEFTYVGGSYCPELVKALVFDFQSGVFQNEYGVVPLEQMDELFQLWQQNFLGYFAFGVYEVTISTN